MYDMSRWRLELLVLVSCSWLFWPAVSSSQEDSETIFLPAPRTLRQHLSRAERALQESRHGDAVLELGALLTPTENIRRERPQDVPQDFFLWDDGAHRVHKSLRSEVQRLLKTMPAEGREVFELQFGGDARALLDTALADGDLEKLSQVVRRYFHTAAGYEAMVLLGRLHLDQGRPLAAALCLQQVVDSPAARKRFEPELSVLLAASWHYCRRPTDAQAVLADLSERFPRVQIQIGDQKAERLPTPENSSAWLTTHFGPAANHSRRLNQWALFRGDATRTGRVGGGIPLTNFRWRARTATDPNDEDLISSLQLGYRDAAIPMLPGLHPLAVDNVILMRTPERLLAIDFQTGKRIWEYPWWNSTYSTVTASRRGGSRSNEQSQRKDQLVQRIWTDAPYGQVSSDGEAVYLLDELRFAHYSHNNTPWFPRPRGGRQANPNYPQPHNQLVSLDLAREGSLRWMVGGESGLDEPELAGAFFLGAPLPLMGQVYALAEINNGEIRLVVLDAKTGKLSWSQQLAHLDQRTILHDRTRRLAGASPSYADGVLVCPTSAGAVVAVDLSTRALLWGHQYEPVPVQRQRFGVRTITRMTPPGQNWMDATVTIHNGTVLLTPAESNKLIGLDLLTGEPKWEPQDRKGPLAGLLFVAGVQGDNAILIGRHSVTAINLETGKEAWEKAVLLSETQAEMPSGRGFLAEDRYYLPTTTANLVEIDLKAGKLANRIRTPFVLGNLLSYRDEVVSQGPDYLSTFFQVEPLRAKVKSRLEEDPKDWWALARQGELYVNDGDLSSALAALRRAQELKPEDVSVRELLISTYLQALREDFATHRGVTDVVAPLITRPDQRIEYLQLTAAGQHHLGDLPTATQAYLELADIYRERLATGRAQLSDLIKIDDKGRARLDRWVQARLSELYESEDGDVRDLIDEQVALRLPEDGSIPSLRQFLSFFGFHPQTNPVRLELMQQLLSAERWMEAELAFTHLAQHATSPLVLEAAQRFAAAAASQGEFELAADWYRLIQTRWNSVETAEGMSGEAIFAKALETEGVSFLLKPQQGWNYGQAVSSIASGPSDRAYRRVIPVPLRERAGVDSKRFQVSYDGSSDGSLVIRKSNGEIFANVPLADGRVYYHLDPGINYCRRLGNLLVAVLADQVIAIDLHQSSQARDDATLWREKFTQVTSSTQSRKGVWGRDNPFDPANNTLFFVKDGRGNPVGNLGTVTTAGICYLQGSSLFCVDALSGERLWERKDMPRGAELVGDDRRLLVIGHESNEALVLSSLDGHLLGRRSIPKWEQRWTQLGANVLAWERLDEGLRLFLRDVWADRDIWSEVYPNGTRGAILDITQLALLQPDGRFQLRTLDGPEIAIETQLESEPTLQTLYTLSNQDRFWLVTDQKRTPIEGRETTVREVSGGMPAPLVRGHVYCFDRKTNRSLWQTPAYVEDYGLPLYQPTNLPTLWWLRQVSTRQTLRSPSQTDKTAVLCMDSRDGRLRFEKQDIPTRTTSFSILPDRENQSVQLLLPNHAITLGFTNEPIPPEPPVQTGQQSSLENSNNRLANLAGSVIKALQSKQGEQDGEEPFDEEQP